MCVGRKHRVTTSWLVLRGVLFVLQPEALLSDGPAHNIGPALFCHFVTLNYNPRGQSHLWGEAHRTCNKLHGYNAATECLLVMQVQVVPVLCLNSWSLSHYAAPPWLRLGRSNGVTEWQIHGACKKLQVSVAVGVWFFGKRLFHAGFGSYYPRVLLLFDRSACHYEWFRSEKACFSFWRWTRTLVLWRSLVSSKSNKLHLNVLWIKM